MGVPKLAVGGLGLSTLAKNNEKTAEQLADEQLFRSSQAVQKKEKEPSPAAESSSDSDTALPPQVPPNKPVALPLGGP